jgi:hypothetical protein
VDLGRDHLDPVASRYLAARQAQRRHDLRRRQQRGHPVSNQTWTWTGTTWAQLHPAANTGRRAYGSLTYDPALQRLVMFGGSNRTRDLTTLWEWNGTTWQQG